MYDNAHDANMRLSESVIMFNGRPVYIHNVREERPLMVVFSYLSGDKGEILKSIEDDRFSLTPVKLGYMNYQGKAVYTQRIPCRRWKQGLHRENFDVGEQHHMDRAILTTAEMEDTILNKYLSYKEALNQVATGECQSAAYHRSFCFSKCEETGLVWLSYRGERAGWVQDGRAVLGEHSQYLAEELEASLENT